MTESGPSRRWCWCLYSACITPSSLACRALSVTTRPLKWLGSSVTSSLLAFRSVLDSGLNFNGNDLMVCDSFTGLSGSGALLPAER